MNNTETNINQKWNSLSVQPERECLLLSTTTNKIWFLSREPQKWSFQPATNSTTWMKTQFVTLMSTQNWKCKIPFWKWPANLSEHFVLDTRNSVLTMISKLRTIKVFLTLKKRFYRISHYCCSRYCRTWSPTCNCSMPQGWH